MSSQLFACFFLLFCALITVALGRVVFTVYIPSFGSDGPSRQLTKPPDGSQIDEPHVLALFALEDAGRLTVLPVVYVPAWLQFPWSGRVFKEVRSRVGQQVRHFLLSPVQSVYEAVWAGGQRRKPLFFGPFGNFSLGFGFALNLAFDFQGSVQTSKNQQ